MIGYRLGICLIVTSLALTGCATIENETRYYKGNTPDLQSADVNTFVAEQDKVVASLERSAGTPDLRNGDDWTPVVNAGMDYAKVRCDRFLDALFWLNRVRETSSKQIEYTGAAATALLALVKATRQLIGITPLGFGLLDQTVNNVGQGLLYNLEPGVVSGLVDKAQGTFRDAIKDTRYTTRGAAMQAIQEYASLCSPIRIEGLVNQAITDSKLQAVDHRLPVPVDKGAEQPSADTGAAGAGPGEKPSDNSVPSVEVQSPPRPHSN